MQVHIIDHNSVHLSLIAKLVVDTLPNVHTITFADTYADHMHHLEKADFIVISGGKRLVHLNPETHRRLTEVLIGKGKPIFGICLGAEALADYFGANIVRLPQRISGPQSILLTDDTLLPEITDRMLRVYQHHHWAIQSPPPELKVLANSPSGTELFKHGSLPIWGSQFHPEVRRGATKGYLVFRAALRDAGFKLRSDQTA